MLVIIGLLILAVLLFGSSAVIGAAGYVLGFIVVVFLLTYLAVSIDGEAVMAAVPAITLTVLGVGFVVVALVHKSK